MTQSVFADAKRIVVKIGSALLVGDDHDVRREWLTSLIADISALRDDGREVVIVSSGAIALGARRLRLGHAGRASLDDAQAAAAAGQIVLSGLYADLLAERDLVAAQLLVTLGDLADRRRYLNASATFTRLLALGTVPVVNENDSIATEEIRFGDNDRLAVRVGQAVDADLVILLSNVTGLCDRDPAEPDATLIKRIPPGADIAAVLGPSTGPGSGGMASKVEAGRIASSSGIGLIIADGSPDHPLQKLLETGTGSYFEPASGIAARKSWLLGHLDNRGTIIIDAGAAEALRNGGSLLAAGIVDIAGDFARGDTVTIETANGKAVARGLVGYNRVDLNAIAGRRSDEHADILGYAPRATVVHRNDMAMM